MNFSKGFLCTYSLCLAQLEPQFYMIIMDYLRMQGELVTWASPKTRLSRFIPDNFAQYSIDASPINRLWK